MTSTHHQKIKISSISNKLTAYLFLPSITHSTHSQSKISLYIYSFLLFLCYPIWCCIFIDIISPFSSNYHLMTTYFLSKLKQNLPQEFFFLSKEISIPSIVQMFFNRSKHQQGEWVAISQTFFFIDNRIIYLCKTACYKLARMSHTYRP
jgi:hypothetical protein